MNTIFVLLHAAGGISFLLVMVFFAFGKHTPPQRSLNVWVAAGLVFQTLTGMGLLFYANSSVLSVCTRLGLYVCLVVGLYSLTLNKIKQITQTADTR